MFGGFEVRDLDKDDDLDLISTRGNSVPYDGVFWLEQIRSELDQTKPNLFFKQLERRIVKK